MDKNSVSQSYHRFKHIPSTTLENKHCTVFKALLREACEFIFNDVTLTKLYMVYKLARNSLAWQLFSWMHFTLCKTDSYKSFSAQGGSEHDIYWMVKG